MSLYVLGALTEFCCRTEVKLRRKIANQIIVTFLVPLLSLMLVAPIATEQVRATAAIKSSTIKDFALAKVGKSYPNGYCLQFVEECYQQLGATRPYSCCASKSGNLFICSSSSTDIPVGATVYFGNCGGGPCHSCGSAYFGHVGIYIGNGYFVHATGGKVQKSSINSWLNKYRGYGYCGNFHLEQDTGTHVNLGTDFYAYIINTYAWKHLTNDTYNVSMRSETGQANQIWKFQRQTDGSYKIINTKDNNVLDVTNFGTTNGTNVAVCNSNDSSAQRWYIYGSSGAYYLKAKCGDLVLDINGGSKSDGANVQMWTKNDSVAQKFQIWKLSEPGKSHVDYSTGTNFTPTSFWWNKTSNTQGYDLKIWKGKVWEGDPYKVVWGITDTSYQVNLPAGYYEAYVDSRNGSLISMSDNVIKFTVANGSAENCGDDFYASIIINKNWLSLTNTKGNVDVRKGTSDTNQVWYFKRQNDGSYTIKNIADGKYLDVDCAKDQNGTNIKVHEYNGSDAQKFYIYGRWSGEYYIKPKCATRVLDVNGGKNNPGDNVQLWDLNYSDAQKFALWKLKEPGKSTLSVNAGTSSSETKLSWTKTSDTNHYVVKIWKDKAWQGNAYKEIKTTDTNCKLELPAGTYEAYVDSNNSYSYTCSNVVKFVVKKGECEHQYSSWSTTKKASCTEKGTEQRKCSICGNVEVREIKATGHQYVSKEILPTDTQKGYTLYTCSLCGYSYKDHYTDSIKQLSYISITDEPNKTVYFLNEKIDTTGMKVVATYSDGSEKQVSGWSISANLGKIGQTIVKVNYSEDGKTVSATYTITIKEKESSKITITYNSCGGDWPEKIQEAEKGKEITLLSEQPNKSFWIALDAAGGNVSQSTIEVLALFSGWFDNVNCSGSVYAPESTQCFSEDTTLYAGYTDARVGELPIPVKDGYQFAGWYTQAGEIVSSDTFILDDCVLVARWDEISSDLIQDDLLNDSENEFEESELNEDPSINEGPSINEEPSINDEPNTNDEQIIPDEPDEEDEEPLQVGDEIVTDHAIYTITKMGTRPSVELTEFFDDDVTDVLVSDTIAIDGVVYSVTSIASKAFYKNTTIKKVTIGNYVTKIGSKAFYGCKSLKNIVIVSEKLKSGKIGASAFSKVYKTVKVLIPSKKYSTYKKMLKKAGIGSKAKIYKFYTIKQ